jgi:hypothetical protein
MTTSWFASTWSKRGALKPLSYSKPIPVLVNHDEARQIGTVRVKLIRSALITEVAGSEHLPERLRLLARRRRPDEDVGNRVAWPEHGPSLSWRRTSP